MKKTNYYTSFSSGVVWLAGIQDRIDNYAVEYASKLTQFALPTIIIASKSFEHTVTVSPGKKGVKLKVSVLILSKLTIITR